MKKLLLLVTLVTVAALYSCSKESISATDVLTDNATATLTDRGGKGGHHQGPGKHHPHDSTHVDTTKHHHQHLDSLHIHHPHDSTHVHPHDTLHVPHDTLHNGGHHGNGGGMGCHVPPAVITVTDLPQAAQDWLAANQPGASIESVVRITRIDCKVGYTVKLADGTKIRFDADGKKLG